MLEIWMITNQGWECVTMNQGVISWITQKQVCIVGSTIEFKNDITYLIAKKSHINEEIISLQWLCLNSFYTIVQ